ncbi:MAG: peptidase S8 [Peptococcaceae bacterium]|jgi:subtilisin|nr:MAG: peptidase S8 [Peptococcaceae bacterium]
MRKIVIFEQGTNLDRAREETIRLNARVIKSLPLINALAVDCRSEAAVKALTLSPSVIRVDDDELVYAIDTHQEPEISRRRRRPPPQIIPWGVNRIDAEITWPITTGAGINVAIVDTGIDITHPDLSVKGGINIIVPKRSFTDDNGHGSHVAGTVAALNNSFGVVGAAPLANLYAVKVLNKRGDGFISDLIEGLQWCIDNKMNVVNMSLGLTADITALHDAVQKVNAMGITQVAAAGNSGPATDTVIYPARYPEVIAVSAIDEDDDIAYFSSRGPEVDLAAPGVKIPSAFARRRYRVLSGTSMATPHVTGTVALVLAAKGAMTPADMLAHLQATAEDLGLLPEEQGAGLVDAFMAVS